MTQTLTRPGSSSGQAAGSGSDAMDKGSKALLAVAVLGTVAAAVASAAIAPKAGYGVVGFLLVILLGSIAGLYPIFGTYAYLVTLPILAGIDRDALIPLVRPNEAVLAVVMAGATIGVFLRYLRGDLIRPRIFPLIDIPLAVFLLMATIWPLASLTLRGLIPDGAEYAGVLPFTKLVAFYFMVRYTVQTEQQILRIIRFIVWPGAVVAMIAVLQTLQFPPVIAFLQIFWGSGAEGTPDTASELGERGSATLGSPIAAGDVIIISLILVMCCVARGLLGRRERLFLALTLGTGVFAAGQFSTWIAAAVGFSLLAWRFPNLRRQATRFAPLAGVALVIGAPAFVGRLSGIGGIDGSWIPEPELGRIDNLSHLYLPHFNWITTLIGVSPNEALIPPETWRNVVYLESGVLYFLWIGGIPLLAAFIWLSMRVLRAVRPALAHPGPFGATASCLDIVWRFLLVLTLIDPHLQLRGSGDLVFTLLAVVTTGLAQRNMVAQPHQRVMSATG
ncbi:hypothetical protein [Pseudonocardia spinosispora]|uniref:hypothetical protein n=1 Tax=Pseudonocardia spinosispora TaxID=103441 RepID=UPI0007E8C7AA|nr:hypothetical protein [Pseudonocardia spinosispora]